MSRKPFLWFYKVMMKRILAIMLCLLSFGGQANALDIPQGTFYFDNSLTKYNPVKFVYGSDQKKVTYVVTMTDEGNDRWSVTMSETVKDMYRYVFAGTTIDDGVYYQTFSSVKDSISNKRNESRTITSAEPIIVGGIYTPTNNEKWASAEWRLLDDSGKGYSGTLPVLFITTEAPVTSKEVYVQATCYIDPLGLEGYEALGSADSQVPLLVKGRGNYTWSAFEKKPYRLKFEDKVKPLGMKKSRHFTLLAHADDNLVFLRNTVGFELSRQLGLVYTPEQQPVEVVLNGNYVGLYMLTDKIRVATKRVNVVEQADMETNPENVTGGWLMEIDNYEEEGQLRMQEGNGAKLRFTFHTPEVLSDVQRNYITGLMAATDDAIYAVDKSSTEWEQYIDLDTLARFYIVQEIMDNAESFHGSCFIHKERGDNTRLIFGPVWDFGNAFHRGHDKFIYQDPPFGQNWIGEIAKYPRFQERVKSLWQRFLSTRYGLLDGFIDDFVGKISTAVRYDANRWPQYGTTDVEGRKNNFKQQMASKVDFLRRNWGEVQVDIMAVRAEPMDSRHWYTLDGRKLEGRPTRSGIYLYGNRKTVVSGRP